jgi:hypothetical protein
MRLRQDSSTGGIGPFQTLRTRKGTLKRHRQNLPYLCDPLLVGWIDLVVGVQADADQGAECCKGLKNCPSVQQTKERKIGRILCNGLIAGGRFLLPVLTTGTPVVSGH